MKRNRGFTLLELMVVVAIVAIVAAFAISSYSENVRKGKRTGGIRGVLEYQMSLEKWRAGCPSYADDTSGTNNCKDRNGDGDAADPGDATYPVAPVSDYYTFALSNLTASSYTITATKTSAFSDPKCGGFIYAVSNGVASKSMSGGGDIDYCWRN